MAKKINWEKEAKRLKVARNGFQPLYKDLPVATGSPAQHRRILKVLRKNIKKAEIPPRTPTRKVVGSGKLKVLRRRKNENIIEVEQE